MTNGVGMPGHPLTKNTRQKYKIKPRHRLVPFTKIKQINIKFENAKFLQYDIESLDELGFGDDFVDMTNKAISHFKKEFQNVLLKLKILFL